MFADTVRDMKRPYWISRLGQAKSYLCSRPMAYAFALSLAIVTAAAVLTLQLRERSFQTAGRELQNLTLTLANQAESAFQAVELVQAAILENLKRTGVGTPDAFRTAMTGHDIYNDLRSRISGLPQIDAVTAIDAEGNLLNFTRYWPIPRVNVADRDYFRALKADPQLSTFISKPVPNRGTGTATIYIARKVASQDGSFLGLILGAVELAYFERLYGVVAPGPESSISLFRLDGTLLARHPHIEASVGRSFAATEVFRQLLASSAQQIQLRQVSLADGRDRLIASHRLQRYPLAVNATLTTEAILVDWRRQAALLLGTAGLLAFTAIGAALALARHFDSRRRLEAANSALELAQERERAERQAHEQDARFAAALANLPQGVIMFDANGQLLAVNDSYISMYALPRALAVAGTPATDIMAHLTQSNISTGLAPLLNSAPREPPAPPDRHLIHEVRDIPDGRTIEVTVRGMAQGGWISTHEDITRRRAAEAHIEHMAHHDALTGLPNRVLLRERLAQAVARVGRGEPCAVLCLDLDRFKEVNDTLGHPIGDALLRAVTERLQDEVRETDTLSRLGGDEFAIVQSGAELPGDARALAGRLVAALSRPFQIEGHQVVIGTSIGIALAPGDGNDPDALLKAADLALYRAKETARGTWCFFEPEMDARMQARRALEIELRRAIALEEFELYYQPVVDAQHALLSGFEALVRWRHPERGMVSPGDFIPLAEETGLIVPLGAWVLQRACADAAGWPEKVKVAVNLSPVQFGGAGPVRAVAAALQASGLDPSRLELEITETAMLRETDAVLAILGELKALGVSIAMDDFGTGYSSLGYLRQFPFDRVKIDRSFIQGLGQCPDSAAIVQAVTGLCSALGMGVTAEGVETKDQLAELADVKDMQVQGYFFSPPRPAADVPLLCQQIGTHHEHV